MYLIQFNVIWACYGPKHIFAILSHTGSSTEENHILNDHTCSMKGQLVHSPRMHLLRWMELVSGRYRTRFEEVSIILFK